MNSGAVSMDENAIYTLGTKQNVKPMKRLIAITAATLLIASVGTRAADPGDVKALYKKSCVKCHGADGKGKTKMGRKLKAKDYSDLKVQEILLDEKRVRTAVQEGLKVKGKKKMKAEKDITDAQVRALIDYMKTFAKK